MATRATNFSCGRFISFSGTAFVADAYEEENSPYNTKKNECPLGKASTQFFREP